MKSEILNKNLAEISVGESAVIKKINCCSQIKRRFMDLGIICGTRVSAIFKSPCGDPMAYLIRGAVIALREDDCKHILIY